MYSNAFVVMMGMGTVFFGLISIIVLTNIMGKITSLPKKQKPIVPATSDALKAPSATLFAAPDPAQISVETMAAISAVLAYETGTGSSNIVNIIKKKNTGAIQ